MSTTSIRVTHRFTASPERVFDALLDPARIVVWMAPPGSGEITRVEVDARVGGHYRFTAKRPGGEVDHVGEYRVIERPTRLVFTFGIAGMPQVSLVTVELGPGGTGTDVTLTQDDVLTEFAERSQVGWKAILTALETAAGA